MSNTCIEKLPHDCGSKDGLQVFQDDATQEYSGYCFACDTYVHHPYGEDNPAPAPKQRKRSAEAVALDIEEIKFTYPCVDLPDRGLRQKYLDYFDIKMGMSEQDGVTPVFHYYPYKDNGSVVAYQVRLVAGKQFWFKGSIKGGVDMPGWDKAVATGGKSLYITEGVCDAVALFQALKEKQVGTQYEAYDPAVVSLVNGASSVQKSLMRHLPDIKRMFKRVVLVFDQDDAGKAAVAEAMSILPDAEVALIPGKDPNECIMEGKSKALATAVLFNSGVPANSRIVNMSTLFAECEEQPEMGLSWPWAEVTEMTRGIRAGETIYIGAGVKMGKSSVLDMLVSHLIVTHDWTVLVAKPEEANKKTAKLILGKVAGKIFHDPKIEVDVDAMRAAAAKVGDKLLGIDLYQHLGWETLRADIISAVKVNGAKAVFIDPITNLTNGMDSGDANSMLQSIAQDLAALAKDLDIVIFIFCHLLRPKSGEPHERGGEVFSDQFAGSRAMMRSCNYMFGLEGNKSPDLPPEERNMRQLVLLEDREFGEVGRVPLYYNDKTGIITQMRVL